MDNEALKQIRRVGMTECAVDEMMKATQELAVWPAVSISQYDMHKRERYQFTFDTADAWIIERAGTISLCHYKACADKARADGAIVTPYFKKG